MTTSLRQVLTCHWSARRLQRYLDADPAVTARVRLAAERLMAEDL